MDSELTESQLEEIIMEAMSRSDEENSDGNSLFHMMKQTYPEALVNKLADYFDSHDDHDTNTRQVCAELLGKLITEDDDFCTWHRLTVSTQSTIKIILLDHLSREESESENIINMVLTTVVKLADSLIPDNNWPELLPFMYQCATNSSSNQNFKRASFLIFEKLAKDIGVKTFPSVKDLHPLLFNALNDDTLDLYPRIAATRAVIRFIQCVPAGSKEKNRFQDLLPGVMRTLTATLSNVRGKYRVSLYVLGFLVELAKNEPGFLRLQLAEMVNSMLEIAEDEKLDEGTRGLAVEFLMNLVEAKEKAPGMMKRVPLFISRCFTMLLNLLLDIKDDPAWHSVEPMDDIPLTYDITTVLVLCL